MKTRVHSQLSRRAAAAEPRPGEASQQGPSGAADLAPDGGRSLKVDPIGLLLPAECACCGAEPSRSLVERRSDGASVIVPYCGECCAHATNPRTRRLAIVIASTVLGVTLALALPLAVARLPLLLHLGLAVGAALLPLLVRGARMRVSAGHSTGGRAVYWLPDGRLYGARARFMALLAELERTRATRAAQAGSAGAGPELRLAVGPARAHAPIATLMIGPLAAAALSPLSSWFFYPLVRVLNLSDRTLVVTLDGRHVGSVEPTTVESPASGLDLHLPAGWHRLVGTHNNGEVVSDLPVVIRAGRQHLYAPGSHGFCFWLETTAYGRSSASGPDVRPLGAGRAFWVLPSHVDSWFAPNPVSAGSSTSGGLLTALRQGACSTAPVPGHP